jgi:hypothetical protein
MFVIISVQYVICLVPVMKQKLYMNFEQLYILKLHYYREFQEPMLLHC